MSDGPWKEFVQSRLKFEDPARRSAMFQCYLLELHGDHASTKYLCSGFAHVLDDACNDINLQQICDGSISGNKIVKTFLTKASALPRNIQKANLLNLRRLSS
jgi:hypothetical protein